MDEYIKDFSRLPLTITNLLDDPNDNLSILNDLVRKCIDDHAPLKRVKLTRPPAPWMKDPKIIALQSKRDTFRCIAHQTQHDDDWAHFRLIRNDLKKSIKSAKMTFYKKALSSKNPREVWKVIHRILDPSENRISITPSELNSYFSSTE